MTSEEQPDGIPSEEEGIRTPQADFDVTRPPETEEEREVPPRTIDEIPEDPSDEEPQPRPGIDTVTDRALKMHTRYHQTQELIWAGRSDNVSFYGNTQEFLPGRTIRYHNPDAGEWDAIGRIVDEEYGRLDPRVGVSASFTQGLRIVTLSVVVDEIDGDPVFSHLSAKENPSNPDLSVIERYDALKKKSRVVRRSWQYHNPYVFDRIWSLYEEFLNDHKEAMYLLPFYSATGEKLGE